MPRRTIPTVSGICMKACRRHTGTIIIKPTAQLSRFHPTHRDSLSLCSRDVKQIRYRSSVYTVAEAPWDLQLDGTRVGGIAYTVNKGYFEAALACQMGANHEATYTDTKTPPPTLGLGCPSGSWPGSWTMLTSTPTMRTTRSWPGRLRYCGNG